MITIMVNGVVQERKKPDETHKSGRGFNIVEKDASGKLSVRYVKTAVIKISIVRKEGGLADSAKDASGAITTYYDKDGKVLRSEFGIVEKEGAPAKGSNSSPSSSQ